MCGYGDACRNSIIVQALMKYVCIYKGTVWDRVGILLVSYTWGSCMPMGYVLGS